MDGVEAILALLERLREAKRGTPDPAGPEPGPPLPAAAPPIPVRLSPAQRQAAQPPPAPKPAQVPPSESLLPFRGGPAGVARAIIAAEVLAPPLGLRDL